jgi:cytoskeleton protein RodZ
MDSETRRARSGGLAAFGEALRLERERRGMTMEAICDATKVSAKYIRALEAGLLGELPGGVFRRGFVRSYVGTLELDQGAWLDRFEACCKESGLAEPVDTEWAAFAENVKNSRMVIRRRMRLRWAGVLAMMAAVAVAGWCCWRLMRHEILSPPLPDWVPLKSWVDKANSR